MSSSSKIVLTYFGSKARAEPIRQALFVGGIDFEDRRISYQDYPALKPSLPLGQLPTLEVDGKVMPQSLSQLRYAGKLAGLYPSDDFEALQVDSIVDTVHDLISIIYDTFFMESEAKIKTRQALIQPDGAYNKVIEHLEKLVASYGGKYGYSVGKDLTIADLSVSGLVDSIQSGNLDGIPSSYLAPFSTLVAVHHAVVSHPAIQAFNKKFNAPKLKLTYFPAPGRAEAIRLAFTYGGIEFEDERITGADFMALKPSLPYKQLPTLSVDGKVYAQSSALMRYAGTLSGTYPSSASYALVVDEIIDAAEDFSSTLIPTFSMEEADKLAARKELFSAEGKATEKLQLLNKRMEELATGKIGFVGGVIDKPSIADFALFSTVKLMKEGFLDGVEKDAMDEYKYIMGVYEAVLAVSQVRDYYA